MEVAAEHLKRSTTVVALQPKPWPVLAYDTNYVEVVVGEEVQALKAKVPKGDQAAFDSERYLLRFLQFLKEDFSWCFFGRFLNSSLFKCWK